MRSIPSLALWLALAVLLRGFAPAWAVPAGSGLFAHRTAPPTEECADHEATVAQSAASAHGGNPCQIACELGAAPALLMHPALPPVLLPSTLVAHVRGLITADPSPPDHPPPIA